MNQPMTNITVPASVAENLRKTANAVCLVDEEGKLLGIFSPTRSPASELSPEELVELKRRLTSPGPRATTQQVLDYLDSREKSGSS